MLIDCGTCQARGDACTDCVVAIVLGSPGGLEADDVDRRALRSLAVVGLVPALRHERPGPTGATPTVTERVERIASG
ncbi:MAG TPA: hypothetical protein VGN54_12580 [Mycobacteriales bacterium]|jgi:hypothetical protein|nr:hypothetical protein [Mycobacteriales bacterium]